MEPDVVDLEAPFPIWTCECGEQEESSTPEGDPPEGWTVEDADKRLGDCGHPTDDEGRPLVEDDDEDDERAVRARELREEEVERGGDDGYD